MIRYLQSLLIAKTIVQDLKNKQGKIYLTEMKEKI